MTLTLKVELLWAQAWRNIAELRAAACEWVDQHNTERPHQALGWQTPAERRAKNLSTEIAARRAEITRRGLRRKKVSRQDGNIIVTR